MRETWNKWSVKALSMLIALVLCLSNALPMAAQAAEDEVVSIEAVPAEAIEIAENVSGWWDTNEDEEPYFYYDVPGLGKQGDVITLHYQSGVSKTYVYDEDEWAWLTADGEPMDDAPLGYGSNQYETPWTVGSDNYFIVYYDECETEVPVSIVENPVESIGFIPVEALEYVEYGNGYWTTDDDDNEMFCYFYTGIGRDGDQFVVHYTSGESKTYMFSSDTCEWMTEDGEVLDTSKSDIYDCTDQCEIPWTVGGNNFMTLCYMGKEVRVPVSIVENPVESIEFVPAEQIQYMEYRDGYWTTDSDDNEIFYYYASIKCDGNQLKVHYKSGASKTYVFSAEEWEWITEDGEVLDTSRSEVDYDSYQYENPWTLGSDNYLMVTYMGCEVQVPVSIVQNPVASIEFVPAEPIQYMEYRDGYWTTDSDDNEMYYYYPDIQQDGNKLIVHYAGGASKTYVFFAEEWEWVTEDGEVLDASESEVDYNTDQCENPWTLGSDNYLTVTYMGREVQVSVTIVENPIASIDFILATPIEIVEHLEGYWDQDEDGEEYYQYYGFLYDIAKNGNQLIVNYTTGASETYTYNANTHVWCTDDGESLEGEWPYTSDTQYLDPWTLGDDNFFSVHYGGREVQVPVTIIENTVESIQFVPTEPFTVFEHTNGWWIDPSAKDRVFYYNYDIEKEGNQIIVTDKIGESKAYIFDYEERKWIAEDGKILNDSYLYCDSNQYDEPWSRGSNNYFSLYYMDIEIQVPVTIVKDPNPVVRIRFTPSSFTFARQEDGWFDTDEEEEEYWYYDYYDRIYDENTSVTVTYKDGTTEVYRYAVMHTGQEYVNEDGECLDWSFTWQENQFEDHWTPDGNNYIMFYYRDASCKVPVTIKCAHESMSYVKMKAATTTKDGYKAHYKCKDCGKRFEDKAGKKATTLSAKTIYKASKISLKDSTLSYTGKYQKPRVVVKNSKGKTISSSNYTVTVSKKKSIGKYSVKIKFKGKYYSGSKTLTWYITPKTTKFTSVKAGKKSLSLKWSKVSKASKYQIQYSTDKKFKKGVKSVTVSAKTASKTIKKLSSKKTYYVRIRAYASKVYGDWSKVKYAKVK